MTPAAATRGRPTALDFATDLLDPDSFRSWDEPIPPRTAPGPYADALAHARARSGSDESVHTGEGRIAGHRIAVLLGEFGFLAGSIGDAGANRLVAAIRRAGAERLPLFASPVSGGTRMQEGTPAFVRMIDITAAIVAHKAAGLPYLVHLRHPTTGGAFASWGSLGHVTTAEPGALIGFLGPRVYEALHGAPFPEHVQRAENLYRRGVLDAVSTTPELRRRTARTLDLLSGERATTTARTTTSAHSGSGPNPAAAPSRRYRSPIQAPPNPRPCPAHAPHDVWRSVVLTRRADRVGLADLLRRAETLVPLSGTGAGERDDAMRIALARIGGTACVVVGHDRERAAVGGPVGPGGLRTARRGMRLAAELGLPLLTVVDTAGAALTPAAEEGALAGEIARCVADLGSSPVPTVSLLLGEGAGGAALALVPAARRIAAEHAWLAPLPPEGASAIVHRSTTRAAELADEQRIGARTLLAAGIVHRVVAESAGAAEVTEVAEPGPLAPGDFLDRLGAAIAEEFAHARAAR
ncbi:acetyl-CoA carboxylase carboxyltransferase subunit alpha/beta (plasmid) [Embleya sp. NBC_00888]|uniref:carboxyl transferase domain-containing protein n=1 Tax=Embleya sp. NBC_00888 TaxID=2975960 RepID=UPI002F9179CC|nr:acetyl-CoA carboxylase carboxyltransferase subunit alpha/beta [Embleya sp. NBC_00888]